MIRYFEDISLRDKTSLNLPDMVFLFTDTLLIFDNIRHRIKIVSNAFVKEKGVKRLMMRQKGRLMV